MRRMENGGILSGRQERTKKVYYEWIRLVACFFVIFNHLKGYVLFMNSSGMKQAFYMVLSVITKINVPLFFMVSGALLLERQENIITVLKKRISRICLGILFFELGIYVECRLYALAQGRDYEFTVKRFIYGVFARELDETGAYWYLYAYLGFLCLLPLLQKLAKQMSRSDFYTLLTLHFVLQSLLPACNLLLTVTGNDSICIAGEFSVPLATSAAFFYPLAGYYLDHKTDIQAISKRKWTGLGTAVLTGIILSCLCVYLEGAASENYISLFDYLLAIAVFLFIKYAVTIRIPKLSAGKAAEAVCFMGSLTFGIYLLDHYFKLILYSGYEAFAESFLPSLFASFGWCVVSMFLGGMTTWILKKMPLFCKIL